ncbi:hypothetical protein CDAR_111451 [Caerostris darwini]|uniref:Uncharacterized protein n=1 Tax=Caerostris darwini TaxID=1538125 RepID=A0AAV4WE42_9ARAC|nr:hypothetical protein CDAR_111451 [Caerostris darwini]
MHTKLSVNLMPFCTNFLRNKSEKPPHDISSHSSKTAFRYSVSIMFYDHQLPNDTCRAPFVTQKRYGQLIVSGRIQDMSQIGH